MCSGKVGVGSMKLSRTALIDILNHGGRDTFIVAFDMPSDLLGYSLYQLHTRSLHVTRNSFTPPNVIHLEFRPMEIKAAIDTP